MKDSTMKPKIRCVPILKLSKDPHRNGRALAFYNPHKIGKLAKMLEEDIQSKNSEAFPLKEDEDEKLSEEVHEDEGGQFGLEESIAKLEDQSSFHLISSSLYTADQKGHQDTSTSNFLNNITQSSNLMGRRDSFFFFGDATL